MSILGTGALSSGLRDLEQVLLRPPRAIGTIIADVVIEERHEDQLIITEHPIEDGAAITDQAYKRPAEVTIHCGWSNSSQVNLLPNLGAGSEDYINEVYAALLSMQEARIPFTLTTGKRIYPNMLIAALSITTDRSSEYALMARIRLRQVLIVATAATTVPAQEDHAQPEKTAPTVDQAAKQAEPKTSLTVKMLGLHSGYTQAGGSTPVAIH